MAVSVMYIIKDHELRRGKHPRGLRALEEGRKDLGWVLRMNRVRLGGKARKASQRELASLRGENE